MLAFEKSIIDTIEKDYSRNKGLSRTLKFLDDIKCEYITITDKDGTFNIVINLNSYKGV